MSAARKADTSSTTRNVALFISVQFTNGEMGRAIHKCLKTDRLVLCVMMMVTGEAV